MYRNIDLQTCLWGLIGFRQNINPKYPNLVPSLLESASGLYVQDQHPLLTIENIDQALQNYDAYNYPVYGPAVVYSEGEKVKYSGKVYESRGDDNEGNQPDTSPADWLEVNIFSQKLEALVRAGMSKLAAAVFQNKKLRESTKTLLQNTVLFDGNGSLQDKEIKLGRFVGFKVELLNHRDMITLIKRIGLQFTTENPAFKLYIFHTSQIDPIAVVDIDHDKEYSFGWHKLDQKLAYLSDEYAPGGSFRIGYYENRLVGQAINRGYDFSAAPMPCNCNSWLSYWRKWSPWISVTPFYVLPDVQPEVDGSGAKMWDTSKEADTWTKSYGINLELSVRCDCTEFLCRERDLFTNALSMQVVHDLLNEMAYGVRNNVLAKEVRDAAQFALLNKPDGNPGVIKKLEKSVAELDFDTSDLNEACLPCDEGHGPVYTSF